MEAEIKQALVTIVGEADFSDAPEALAAYGSGTGTDAQGKPAMVVKPHNTQQIKALVDLAKAKGLSLTPVSSQGPRLKEGALPAVGSVMVDLSELTAIAHMDRRNKVAIVEPGVTFAQLKAQTEKAGLKVLMPLLPKAGKSVLASYLDREPILIPKYHWDMTDPLLCTELVFGTGDIFRTGSAAGPGSLEQQWATGAAQKNPMGPAQTDLVRLVQGSQGTMGIAAWASVKLEVLPSLRRCYFIPSEDINKLADFSYKALRQKLADEFLILNNMALAAALGDGPEEIKALATKQAPFTLIYCVAGYEYFPEDRVAYQEQDIAGIAQQCGLVIQQETAGANGKHMLEVLDNPSPEPYWKTRPAGGFRDVFFLTTLDRAAEFTDIMRETAGRHGYPQEELAVYIQPIRQGCACHLEFSLFYDPSTKKETKRIDALVADASKTLSEAGAFFSRPYGPGVEAAYSRCPDTVAALRTMKGILDPGGVLNRGKLCFTEEV